MKAIFLRCFLYCIALCYVAVQCVAECYVLLHISCMFLDNISGRATAGRMWLVKHCGPCGRIELTSILLQSVRAKLHYTDTGYEHRLRTPPTDKLTILQQICHIAMPESNISTCPDVGMWQIFVSWWCSLVVFVASVRVVEFVICCTTSTNCCELVCWWCLLVVFIAGVR